MMNDCILVVEDDRDIRDSLIDALEDKGHEVIGALDGRDALEQLRENGAPPRLILLDLTMPRMNGEQFREQLARVPEWSAVPIIVITADADGRARAQALGAVGFLKKPIRLTELYGIIDRALGAA